MDIPEPGLQKGIRVPLGKSERDITVEDMENLTELDAYLEVRGAEAGSIRSL